MTAGRSSARWSSRANSRSIDHPEVIKLYDGEIKKALAGFAQYEQVHRFKLIPNPFTVENGLLTPSLKTKRPQVIARYSTEFEKMYEGH